MWWGVNDAKAEHGHDSYPRRRQPGRAVAGNAGLLAPTSYLPQRLTCAPPPHTDLEAG